MKCPWNYADDFGRRAGPRPTTNFLPMVVKKATRTFGERQAALRLVYADQRREPTSLMTALGKPFN